MADPESGFAIRQERIKARQELMARLAPRPARVRVVPANEDLRRNLKHPAGQIKFPETGSVEWPLDRFTRRRIAEGSVTEEKAQPQPHAARRAHPSE
jgi:hypothetical protein